MRLEIDPVSGLTDEVPSVRVVEGPLESEVALSAAVTDAENHHWCTSMSPAAVRPGGPVRARDPAGHGRPIRDGRRADATGAVEPVAAAAPVAPEPALATATTGSVEVVAGTPATAEIVAGAIAGDHDGDGKKGVKLSGAKLGTGFF